MTQGSSLPPPKKKQPKLALVVLLLLIVAGGLWLLLASGEPEPEVERAEPTPEPPAREQFAPEIEIPEEPQGGSGGAEPVAAPTEPSQVRPADWDCRGSLEAAQIRSVISGQPSNQVRTCYERRLKDDNLLQGSMTLLLTIGASGSVKAVSVDGSLNDSQVYACVKRVAKTWKFPKPEGGCVRTEIPFQMTPKL